MTTSPLPLKTCPLLVKSNGEFRPFRPANGTDFTLAELQGAVGGYIELVQMEDDHYMVVNEDGLGRDLPFNDRATFLLSNGSLIVGDVVICPTRMVL